MCSGWWEAAGRLTVSKTFSVWVQGVCLASSRWKSLGGGLGTLTNVHQLLAVPGQLLPGRSCHRQ